MTNSLQRLKELLQKLPGIGPKTASRLSYFILTLPRSYCSDLASALNAVSDNVKNCQICFNYTESDICSLCSDPARDKYTICVVEHPKNIRVIENSQFKGQYHVIGGVISPLEGIGPEHLRINEFIQRVKKESFREIIYALSPRLEADTTIDYISGIISEHFPDIIQTKPASGIPVGSDLEYADSMTLFQALSNRRKI